MFYDKMYITRGIQRSREYLEQQNNDDSVFKYCSNNKCLLNSDDPDTTDPTPTKKPIGGQFKDNQTTALYIEYGIGCLIVLSTFIR